ncbi:MAG: hypothetical protein U5Q03_09395 [Bacteroidota bacterium]|nr:hypothetical protein [Bacteroidota bacterium]
MIYFTVIGGIVKIRKKYWQEQVFGFEFLMVGHQSFVICRPNNLTALPTGQAGVRQVDQ